MPSSIKIFKGAKMTGGLLMSFVLLCSVILLVESPLHLVLVAVGVVMAFAVYFVIRLEVSEIVRHVNYSNLGVRTEAKNTIVELVSWLVFGAVLSALIIVSMWTYLWQISLIVVIAYVVSVLYTMHSAYDRMYLEGHESHIPKVYHLPKPVEQAEDTHADLPEPVYGVVKYAPKNARL
jgi:hypothetical protein